MSKFYDTTQEGGPREKSWYAAKHGFLKPGDHVTYENPLAPSTGPTGIGSGEHVITELIDLGSDDDLGPSNLVTAILDDGIWEVQADNLRRGWRPMGTASDGRDRWAKLTRELAGEATLNPALCTCGCPLHDHGTAENTDPDLKCANRRTCGCTGWVSSTIALRTWTPPEGGR